MSTALVWATPEAEKVIMRCARVSSKNPDSDNTKLLTYCMEHGHVSIFEMASMCVDVVTTRTVSRQMIRHKSFSFQEFSQRYANVVEKPIFTRARRQDKDNRQNSIDDLPASVTKAFIQAQLRVWDMAYHEYEKALADGVAKECARVLLPEGMTRSHLYMTGTMRSWIHYCLVRCGEDTQLEHRAVAMQIRDILCKQLPTLSGYLKGKE
jgi:thymidylate synthase (FAD)